MGEMIRRITTIATASTIFLLLLTSCVNDTGQANPSYLEWKVIETETSESECLSIESISSKRSFLNQMSGLIDTTPEELIVAIGQSLGEVKVIDKEKFSTVRYTEKSEKITTQTDFHFQKLPRGAITLTETRIIYLDERYEPGVYCILSKDY